MTATKKEELYLDKSETNSEHSVLADDDNNEPLTKTVDYETRDGIAKYSKDYKSTQGTLVRQNR